MTELLSPAGDFESLQAAVQCGADAVYFGCSRFNARASAANFSNDDVRRAIDYCHERSVKAYITMNTLLREDELNPAYDLSCAVGMAGADALIIQDLGLFRMLRDNTNIPLHASTQLCLHNVPGARIAKDMGFSRIVLSRETPIKDIQAIKSETGCETEVFVHGALCVAFSGQCLLSSITGGRSGNRGCCAQPCRLPYTEYFNNTVVGEGYLLSSKDLCTVERIFELAAVCDSLKIEGRLKRPEYVGIVTRAYRRMLDAADAYKTPAEAKQELKRIFNRGGFTQGYCFDDKNIIYTKAPNNMGVKIGKSNTENGSAVTVSEPIMKGDGIDIRRNGVSLGGGAVITVTERGGQTVINPLAKDAAGADVYKTLDSLQIKEINEFIRGENRPVFITMRLTQTQEELKLSMSDGIAQVTGSLPYRFTEGNTADADIIKGCEKLGGTPLSAVKTEVLRPAGYIPAGTINALRRITATAMLSDITERARRGRRCAESVLPEAPHTAQRLRCCTVYDADDLAREAVHGWDGIIYKPFEYDFTHPEIIDKAKEGGAKLFFAPFEVAFSRDIRMLTDNAEYLRHFDGIYAGNLYAVQLARMLNMPVRGDFGLNVLNTRAAAELLSLGLESVSASFEASKEDLKCLNGFCTCEAAVYGDIPLMILSHCPRKTVMNKQCGACSGELMLKDRAGYLFKVLRFRQADCRHVLFNSRCLDLTTEGLPAVRYLPGSDTPKTKGRYNRGL